MKFVRWLGAFKKGTSLSEAAGWELSQTERQVAVEPLWRGRSLITKSKIGLEIDHQASVFASGWLSDAWTEVHADGTLRSDRSSCGRRDMKRFRNQDRFLSAWSKMRPTHHAEAVFAAPVYRAVVVKKNATAHGMGRARRLAAQLNLPLKVIAA